MASESQRKSDYTDIRFIIMAAIGSIAVFLLICSGFTTGADEMAKTGGVNGNLWAGIGLAIVALVMGVWWWVKPEGGASPSGD